MIPVDVIYGPTYRADDRLEARDLTAWQRAPLFALARHFRELHRYYGVAEGIRLSVETHAGAWQVRVSEGTAYDSYGRPLSVPKDANPLVVQENKGALQLVILRGEKPPATILHQPAPTPQDCEVVCVTVGRENGLYVSLKGWEVPLARLDWNSPNAGLRLDQSWRANTARAFQQPFLAAGVLPAGQTAVPLSGGVGWQVWVDTSSAGFLPPRNNSPAESANAESTDGSSGLEPVYALTIGKPNQEDAVRFLTGEVALANDGAKELAAKPVRRPLVYVSNPSHKGFTLTVRYPDKIGDLEEPAATPLDVYWVGVERSIFAMDADHPLTGVFTRGTVVKQLTDRPRLQWPEFHNGKLLTAEALNAVQDTARQLLWLHNRTLHDWGVAEGYTVAALPNKHGVRIDPGYALDSQGRELIVNDLTQLNNPPRVLKPGEDAGKKWWVTVSYPEGKPPRADDATCRQSADPIRELPQAILHWRDPDAKSNSESLAPGLDVILATVTIEQGEVTKVTNDGRRPLVPPRRPYLQAGRQKIMNDDWQPWPENGQPVAYQATIGTDEAEFSNTPRYFFTVEQSGQSANADVRSLAAPLTIVDAKRSQFTVAVAARFVPRRKQWPPAIGFILACLVLFAVVLGGAWLSYVAIPDNWRQFVGTTGVTAAIAVALKWPTTAAGQRAKKGLIGSRHELWNWVPSLFVQSFTGLSAWTKNLVGQKEEWPLPTIKNPNRQRISAGLPTLVALLGILNANQIAPGVMDYADQLGVSELWRRIPDMPDSIRIFFPMEPASVFGVWFLIIAALTYGSTKWAGKSLTYPWSEWKATSLKLLQWVPDQIIHLLPDPTADNAAATSAKPPDGDGDTDWNSKTKKPSELTIAWIGIES